MSKKRKQMDNFEKVIKIFGLRNKNLQDKILIMQKKID